MITFELQINNFEISISTDELFYYVSVIDYTYSATDAMNNVVNHDRTLTYAENESPLIQDASGITNTDIINFLLSREDFGQIQKNLKVQLDVVNYPVTYRWYIYEMETIPFFNGLSNFVSKIRWRYNATSEDGFVSDIEGMTTFNEESGTGYVDYYNLTESEVISWLDSSNDIGGLQFKLNTIISEKRNPAVVVLPLPW